MEAESKGDSKADAKTAVVSSESTSKGDVMAADESKKDAKESKPLVVTDKLRSHESAKVVDLSALLGDSASESASRKDLKAGVSFVIKNFLTKDECAKLIEATEKLGYESLAQNWDPQYRSNTRLVCMDQKLSEKLWQRIAKDVPATIKTKEHEWTAAGLNESLRFCRYEPGQHFSRHVDGPFERSDTEVSHLTFMIYLNTVDGENCGATRFFDYEDGKGTFVCDSVQPEEGLLLVFMHDNLHDGEKLAKGKKYIVRSEVMYTRKLTEQETRLKERQAFASQYSINFRY